MDETSPAETSRPKRLGLALSGGGLRAAFFHLGVLRRLAELDLLRHVWSLSTVSGGSILAAHYYLHFKRRFEEKHGRLSQADYIGIVDELEREFIDGTRRDLRNRLFMNPWTHLRALLLGRSYGKPMARLYSRCLYRAITKELYPQREESNFQTKGIPLHRAIIHPPHSARPGNAEERRHVFPSSGYPGVSVAGQALREVNTATAATARIPHVLFNATCLNTGGPFTFTFNEIGSPDIGYIRTDEVFMLIQYKLLIANVGTGRFDAEGFAAAERDAMGEGVALEKEYGELPNTAFKGFFPFHTSEHLQLYVAIKAARAREAVAESWLPQPWETWQPASPTVRYLLQAKWSTVERLLEIDLGTLRRAKASAWYLLDDLNWSDHGGAQTRGGFTQEEHRRAFWNAIDQIDLDLGRALRVGEQELGSSLRLVLDFYYFRTAEITDWEAPETLHELTLSHAVAASANFPPVFTPFKIFKLFDRDVYDVISLTDGGVNDNQGIDALIEDSCSYVIASDAGGLLQHEPDPPESRLPMMDRIIDVLMGGLRRVQLRSLHEVWRVSDLLDRTTAPARDLDDELLRVRQMYSLQRAAVFHMTSNPREGSGEGLPSFEANAAAQIRTDLDAFNDVEMNVLTYQGYQLADRFTRWFAVDERSPFRSEGPLPEARAPRELPSSAQARRILRGSAKLVGRFGESKPLAATVVGLLVGVVLLLLTFMADLDLSYVNAERRWADDKIALTLDDLVHTQTWLWAVDSEFHELLRSALHWNLLAIVPVVWGVCILLRLAARVWRQRKRRFKTFPKLEIWKSRLRWLFGLSVRLPNLVAIVCLVTFFVTGRAKWLLGIVPLWSIPLALVFAFVHFAITPLWRFAGRSRVNNWAARRVENRALTR